TDVLGLQNKKKLKHAAAALAPDSHGLTILPFWAGERSPNWRGDARAVIAGLSLGSQPHQMLRAAMEAITYQLVTEASAMRPPGQMPTLPSSKGRGRVGTPSAAVGSSSRTKDLRSPAARH